MIIVDISGIGYAATAANNLSVGGVQTGGVFGSLKMLRKIREEHAGKMVVVHDGRSWRKNVYPEYKANRSGNPALVKIKESWIEQKPKLVEALTFMGVTQLWADNYEADDLAASCVHSNKSSDQIALISGDKDWTQLVDNRTSWFDPVRNRSVRVGNFQEFSGYDSTWAFVQSKALTGDVGDNIKGVGGVGPVNTKWVFDNMGSVDSLLNESLLGCSSSWPKPIVDFADSEEKIKAYRRNLLLVWLNHPDIPKAVNPRVVRKPMDVDGFTNLAEELNFTSMLRAPDVWLAPFANS